jgi:hypothetical protein
LKTLPFSKWRPKYGIKYSTLSDIIEIWYVGRQWCPELIPYIEKFLPVLIFKMAATIRKISTLSDIIKIWYVGSQWYPELIPDIEKFLPVAIFKMADTIPHKFNIVRFSTPFHMWVDYDVPNWFLTSKNFYRSPYSKWPPQYRTNSTLFDFNVLNIISFLI